MICRLCRPWEALATSRLAILNSTLQKLPSLDHTLPHDYTADLFNILAAPDLSLALSLVETCATSEHEGMMDLIMQVLTARGLDIKLLKAVVEQEISTTGESM